MQLHMNCCMLLHMLYFEAQCCNKGAGNQGALTEDAALALRDALHLEPRLQQPGGGTAGRRQRQFRRGDRSVNTLAH